MTDNIIVKVTKVVTEIHQSGQDVTFTLTTGQSGATVMDAYDKAYHRNLLVGRDIMSTEQRVELLPRYGALVAYHQFITTEAAIAWVERYYDEQSVT